MFASHTNRPSQGCDMPPRTAVQQDQSDVCLEAQAILQAKSRVNDQENHGRGAEVGVHGTSGRVALEEGHQARLDEEEAEADDGGVRVRRRHDLLAHGRAEREAAVGSGQEEEGGPSHEQRMQVSVSLAGHRVERLVVRLRADAPPEKRALPAHGEEHDRHCNRATDLSAPSSIRHDALLF
eukprot:scaffold53_cov193-Pinguiococcus_pyrenoidosus.AAC.5